MTKESRCETTLASVAEFPDAKNYLLFAVIIDISEPFRSSDNSHYVTKMKVVDPSFNFLAQLKLPDLKFHKFVHVSIFTDTVEEAPRIRFVGDIARLRRFCFRYSDRGELRGCEMQRSNWLVYSGRCRDVETPISFKACYSKNIGRRMNGFEVVRLEALRAWADLFFSQNSLSYITWWTDLDHAVTAEEAVRRNGVDLVLKCTKSDAERHALEFVNSRG